MMLLMAFVYFARGLFIPVFYAFFVFKTHQKVKEVGWFNIVFILVFLIPLFLIDLALFFDRAEILDIISNKGGGPMYAISIIYGAYIKPVYNFFLMIALFYTFFLYKNSEAKASQEISK